MFWGPVDSFSLKDFNRTFAVNVCAVFVATQAALKHFAQHVEEARGPLALAGRVLPE